MQLGGDKLNLFDTTITLMPRACRSLPARRHIDEGCGRQESEPNLANEERKNASFQDETSTLDSELQHVNQAVVFLWFLDEMLNWGQCSFSARDSCSTTPLFTLHNM
jgi:hypothetical protein